MIWWVDRKTSWEQIIMTRGRSLPIWVDTYSNQLWWERSNNSGRRTAWLHELQTARMPLAILNLHIIYICMKWCIYICIYICNYVYIYIYIYVCNYECIYIHMKLCVYIYIHVIMYIYIYEIMCVCIYIFICNYVYIYT